MIFIKWPVYIVPGASLPLFPSSSISYFSGSLLEDGTLDVSMTVHGLREIRKDPRWLEKK